MGICEIGCGRMGVQMHHRKNRSQMGRWEPDNILHLCVECHKRVTEHPAESYEFGWSVRSGFNPADVSVKWCGTWALLDAAGGVQS